MALPWRWPSPAMLPALKRSPMIWKGVFLRIPWCDSVTCRCFERVLLSIRADPSKAIEMLQVAVPYELGASGCYFGALYPIYVRGEAHLAARQGAEAAAEFQKILDHRGIVGSDPIGALAHLQIGRAFSIAGDKTKAKTAYQDFFTLWRDADLDIPILTRARDEYANLD